MELSPRKQAVLKAVVKAYIENGEPVGSKHLAALLENAPSSATLRNEMSELCALGLLAQPHTSAGRIPTNAGYQMYVDSLMCKTDIEESTRQYIDHELSVNQAEPEDIPSDAARCLTALLGLPAITCLLTRRSPRLKRIELVRVGRSAIMLLVITDDGRSRSRTFRKSGGFSEEECGLFMELCEKKLMGKLLSQINTAYIQGLAVEAGGYALELTPLFSAVLEMACQIDQATVILKGENALYNICANETEARQIMSLIKNKDPMLSVLEKVDQAASAVFGCDTGYTELNQRTLIAAQFKCGDKYKGYIGVIGSNRMSYERIMPVIEYTASKLSEIMTVAQKDMED